MPEYCLLPVFTSLTLISPGRTYFTMVSAMLMSHQGGVNWTMSLPGVSDW